MLTENTSLKNITPTGDSNTTHEMVIGKSNTYQRHFLIVVACSALALQVLFAVAWKTAGYSLVYTRVLDESDSTNYALTKELFDFGAAENDEVPGCVPSCASSNPACWCHGFCSGQLNCDLCPHSF